MVHALAAQKRKVDFVETSLTSQVYIIVRCWALLKSEKKENIYIIQR
jgi:hypothetical protein